MRGVQSDSTGIVEPDLSPPLAVPRSRLRRMGSFLGSSILGMARHPGRALLVVGLLLLIGVMVGLSGLHFYFEYQLGTLRQAVAQGHNLEAMRGLDRCRRLAPNHPEILLLAARLARRSGLFDQAQNLLDAYWKQKGDDDDLVLERLLLRASRGDIDPLVPVFEERIRNDDPAAPLLSEALILGSLHAFRLVDADRHVGAWLRREPDSPPALWQEGRVHELAERTSSAVESYRRCLEIDPAFDEARIRLATLLVQLEKGQEALPHAEYLSRRLGFEADVELARARALDLLDRSPEAIAILDGLLERQPKHAEALGERGRLALRAGDSVLAEEFLQRAVRRDGGNRVIRYQLVLALSRNGKPEQARQEQEKITALEADLAQMRKIITEQIPRSPANADLCYEVALIALRAGIPRETFRWLQNALRIDPDHLLTHRALATYYEKMGNPVLSSHHRSIAQRLSQTRPGSQEKP